MDFPCILASTYNLECGKWFDIAHLDRKIQDMDLYT